MTPTPTALDGKALDATWRYSINYGPDGEENWANVYDDKGALVGNLRTYHAVKIVNALSPFTPSPTGGVEPVAWQRRLMNTEDDVGAMPKGTWGKWQDCSEGLAQTYNENGGKIEGFPELRAEVRALCPEADYRALSAYKDWLSTALLDLERRNEALTKALADANADYNEARQSHLSHVRDLDVAMNGDGAAASPLLIDIKDQLLEMIAKLGEPHNG